MAFVCQLCGASSDARGSCATCQVPRTPAGMVGDAIDAIAEPPAALVASGGLARAGWVAGGIGGFVLASYVAGGLWPRFFDQHPRAFGVLALATLFAMVGGGRLWRWIEARAAWRRLRARLDAHPTVAIADAKPGVVRVRGRLRLRDPTPGPVAVPGVASQAFSIVDETGSIDVEPGEVIAAWDGDEAPLADGAWVEAIGFVSVGPARPGRGFRDVVSTLEMHGRQGVPLYLRRASGDVPRVRVATLDGDDEESPEPRPSAARTSTAARTPER